MRLPLELIRLVLWHYQNDVKCQRKELYPLRLVSRTFDEEILEYMFAYREPWSWTTFNVNTWHNAPWRLRRLYLYRKIRRQGKEPNFFAYLFLPVFERHAAAKGIAVNDEATRHEVMDELLSLPIQDADRHMARDFVHGPDSFDSTKDYFYEIRTKRTKRGGRPNSIEESREKHIAADWEFAKACLAIKNNETELVDAMLRDRKVSAIEPCRCFATTLLKFALRHGNLGTFSIVLENVGGSFFEKATKMTYDIFNVAMSGHVGVEERVDLLIRRFVTSQVHIEREKTIRDIFVRARANDYVVLLDRTICWMKENMEEKERKHLMNASFRKSIISGNFDILQRISLEVDVTARFVHPHTVDRETPIEVAMFYAPLRRKLTALKYLLVLGADVNQSKEAFRIAARCGHVPFMRAMLTAGYRLETREEVLLIVREAYDLKIVRDAYDLKIVRDAYELKRTRLLSLLEEHGWDKAAVAMHCNSYSAEHDCSLNGCGSLRQDGRIE